VLSLVLTFAGNAEDFDAVAEANFRTSLAELLGVNVTSVLLQVRSGSIVIDVRVFMSQPLASSLLTAASLSGALGVNITNIVSTYSILEIQAPSPPPPSPPPSQPPPSPPPSPPPPSMPPTEMVRALELFYEATGGNAWRNNFKWLSGEPCVDGWFGVHCCPQELPVLRGDDECTAEGGGATGVRTTQGSAACHSGSTTGTALDLATCFVVKVLLPSNNLVGSLDGALCELPFLQHLDLSGNVLTGSLPSAADCLPRLTYLDLTQTRSWDDEGGVSGRVPEWLLDRLDFMAPLRLANNALDDPTAAESAVAISRIWQRCQTLGAEQCSGVPPIGCSAFNRQGQRYEVELDGLGCVRCPTPLEMGLVGGGIAFIVLLLAWLLGLYTRFMRKYPEHAKIRFATFMILVGHLQTLTIIGSMQLGWPLIIQEILASINLPFLSYIPLPCILTDPVVKALLSYAETAGVLLLLLGARLVASEYYLSVLFSFLFTFGLRASVTLFMRYDEDQTRLIIARLVASLLWLFWLFLLRRFHWLLREARVTAAAKVAPALAGRIEMGEDVVVNGRRGKITSDNRTSNPYQVTFDNGEVSGWLFPHGVTRDVTRAARAARVKSVIRQKKARRAAEAVRHLTERYASDDGPSHGEFLLWAEGKIDGPIRERLKDGTIRLLRCAWLLSKDSDRHLGRDASCKVILRRRQELPEEAFFTKEEAVELLDRADRSILALSYRWLTREHPDPHGTALSAVRRFLRSKDGLGKCGMFWDFASLPQKDIAKEARGLPPRTPEEAATMKRGLDGMGYFYASVCGTAVVQLKDIPPRPSEYDGRMIVFDEEYSEMTIVKDLIADLERFGGKITEIAIRPTVISATHKQEGEAHVTFATHKQAERCITALREVGRGACTVYNETAYSSDRGETFSGWCTFEQGCSKLVVAHLNKASRQASSRLPERLVRANASRAKVTDISEEKVSPVDVKESPAAILKQSNKDIEKATFVGKGEAETVKQLLATLEGSMKRAMEEAKADPATADQLARARWPLRSQWQLVVWARQGLLFLVSFAMDCVMWFSPYEAHRTARYVFAAIAIAVLGGFWWLQARRQPYAMRQQHWLEAFLLAVDILAIVLACVYGALTNDGTVQDGFGRLALELGLGALLIVSVVGAALLILFEYAYERWYRRQWYLHHGLVKALEGTKEARQIIDEPIEAALRDGAVRLIDCAWLLDSDRSDKHLPRVTKVVARLAFSEPRSVLIWRLAKHCGTSSICITVEAALAASVASPPPSPPEVPPAQFEKRPSAGHMLSRLRQELAPRRSRAHMAPQAETGVSPSSHPNTVVVTFHLSTFDEAATLTATDLRRKAKAVRDRLAQFPGLESVEILEGAFFLPRCQDMPPDAFLPPQRSADLYAKQRRGVKVVSYGWRSPGVPDPDGCALAKIREAIRSLQEEQEEQEELGLFVDVACMPQTFSSPSWYDPKETLRFGAHVDQGPLTVLKFEWECVATERVATEEEAQVCIDKLVTLCEQEGWSLAPMARIKSLGLAEEAASTAGAQGMAAAAAVVAPAKEAKEAATELRAAEAKEVAVLFHGRYVRGAYRFDEGEYRIDNGRYISEGYVRFLKAGDADAARRHSDFKRMCGGKEQKKTKFLRMCAEAKAKAMELFQMCGNAKAKAKAKSELNEPTLMGEHVFENELKFKRGLSVMGSLYASATGTCVLQLTDPPGMLGHDGAPSELVSERTGTVFVIEDKSLKDMSLEELQMELGDGVLAWEKGSWDKVVVRVDDETAARAARSLNERGYPLRRKDRKVKSMYNLRPYDSRGWPTFERSAASIVLAHVTQRKRLGEKLSEELKQAEASSLKLINIDVTGAPREVLVAQSPEHHLRECKKLMLSKRIVFTGRADQKQVVQLLSDFEDSIAVQFDQKRAEHLNLCTEHLEHALAVDMREARRMRVRKLLQRPTLHVEPTLIRLVSSFVSSMVSSSVMTWTRRCFKPALIHLKQRRLKPHVHVDESKSSPSPDQTLPASHQLANSSEVTKDPLFASSDKLTRDYPTSVRHSTNYRRSHKDLMDEMVLKSVPGRTRMRTLGTMPGNEPSAPIPEGTEMSSIVGWGEGSSQRAKERSTEMSSFAGGTMHVVKRLSWKELTLKESLGAGSFGGVRVAVWNSTPCAIKSLRAATTLAALQELLNEFELTMRLHHPNVLLTMGIAHDDDDGKTGILMELMPASLLDVLHHHQQREQLATWEASLVLIALDVAKGMAYLHAMDVVHRDLKPGNVLLTEHWVAKVADFGTALTKYAGHAEGAAGTPPYMAPEAIALTSGAKAKPTDVWSFGCMLAHMGTRSIPYSHVRLPSGTPSEEDLRALMAIIANGQATPLDQLRKVAGCPPVILALTTRCLQTDPVQRPAFLSIVDELHERIQGELRASSPSTKLLRADVLRQTGASAEPTYAPESNWLTSSTSLATFFFASLADGTRKLPLGDGQVEDGHLYA
jgi:serine/threonine protein kinase